MVSCTSRSSLLLFLALSEHKKLFHFHRSPQSLRMGLEASQFLPHRLCRQGPRSISRLWRGGGRGGGEGSERVTGQIDEGVNERWLWPRRSDGIPGDFSSATLTSILFLVFFYHKKTYFYFSSFFSIFFQFFSNFSKFFSFFFLHLFFFPIFLPSFFIFHFFRSSLASNSSIRSNGRGHLWGRGKNVRGRQ